MKKSIAQFLTLVISITALIALPSFAIGEGDNLHLLWDIPFTDVKEVQIQLREKKGLDCEYEAIDNDDSTRHQLMFESTPDVTLLGYPFSLMYTTTEYVSRNSSWPAHFSIYFNLHDTGETSSKPLKDIMNGLIDKYGEPSVITVEFYSHGKSSWSDRIPGSTHEVIKLDTGNTARDLDFLEYINAWEYHTDTTDVSAMVFFNNIFYSYTYRSRLGIYGSPILISFYEYPLIFPPEECFETIPDTEYVDDGF